MWNQTFEFIIALSMIYVISQLEVSGSYILDILFEQFYFDLVTRTRVSRNAKFNDVKLKRLN